MMRHKRFLVFKEIRGEQKDHTQDNSEREYIHP